MTRCDVHALPKYRRAAIGSAVMGPGRTARQLSHEPKTLTKSAASKHVSQSELFGTAAALAGDGEAIIRVFWRLAQIKRQRN
jgi:hypothetical protein